MNKSSQPATLFVAEEDEQGLLGRLVGSATPNVVPPSATVKVTFLLPAKGKDWAIFVNPGPNEGPVARAGRDVPAGPDPHQSVRASGLAEPVIAGRASGRPAVLMVLLGAVVLAGACGADQAVHSGLGRLADSQFEASDEPARCSIGFSGDRVAERVAGTRQVPHGFGRPGGISPCHPVDHGSVGLDDRLLRLGLQGRRRRGGGGLRRVADQQPVQPSLHGPHGPQASPGPGIDELLTALASQPGITAGPLTDVTVDGYSGKYVEVTVATDIATCPVDDGDAPLSGFWLWASPDGDRRYVPGLRRDGPDLRHRCRGQRGSPSLAASRGGRRPWIAQNSRRSSTRSRSNPDEARRSPPAGGRRSRMDRPNAC